MYTGRCTPIYLPQNNDIAEYNESVYSVIICGVKKILIFIVDRVIIFVLSYWELFKECRILIPLTLL